MRHLNSNDSMALDKPLMRTQEVNLTRLVTQAWRRLAVKTRVQAFQMRLVFQSGCWWRKKWLGTGEPAQLVRCFPHKHKDLSLDPQQPHWKAVCGSDRNGGRVETGGYLGLSDELALLHQWLPGLVRAEGAWGDDSTFRGPGFNSYTATHSLL